MLAPDIIMGWTLGGNRTGKSELGAMLDLISAMGRDNPIAQRWARINQVDISCIPEGPGVAWNSAPSFNDSRRYVRTKLDRWAPMGSTWRNRNAEAEAELHLPGGGLVVCKANTQGREAFQGDAVRTIRFDEECKVKGIIAESMMRIADTEGRLWFTMTPLDGWTDLLLDHIHEPDEDTNVVYLHGKDNPHVSAAFLEKLYRKFPAQRAARERGEVVVMEGLVYDMWERGRHVIKHFTPPKEWPRYLVIDFGTRNPACWLFAAMAPDDRLHIYNVHYAKGLTLSQHVRRVKAMWAEEQAELGVELSWDAVIADPEDAGARMSLANEHGISTVMANKAISAGINCVMERLLPQADGLPALYVHDNCTPVIRELEGYQWADRESKNLGQPNVPVKKNDHAMDTVRYLSMYLDSQNMGVGVAEYDMEGGDDEDLWLDVG